MVLEVTVLPTELQPMMLFFLKTDCLHLCPNQKPLSACLYLCLTSRCTCIQFDLIGQFLKGLENNLFTKVVQLFGVAKVKVPLLKNTSFHLIYVSHPLFLYSISFCLSLFVTFHFKTIFFSSFLLNLIPLIFVLNGHLRI